MLGAGGAAVVAFIRTEQGSTAVQPTPPSSPASTLRHTPPHHPTRRARRPANQTGSKLLHVSDLLTLGWATIIESL